MVAPHILFVDDDHDTCSCMCDVLTDRGYQVDVACDGPAALELVGRQPCGLALLDYRMPGMDGLELYGHLRDRCPGVVGILVTAFASRDTAAAALRAGVRRVLPKPVDFGQLFPLIEEVIGRPA